MLDVADDSQRSGMLEVLVAYAPVMRRYSYGKHILTRLERMLSARSLVGVAPATGTAASAPTASSGGEGGAVAAGAPTTAAVFGGSASTGPLSEAAAEAAAAAATFASSLPAFSPL